MIELRPIQKEKAIEACSILNKYGCVYIAGQVRSGKTLTSLETARLFNAKCVLFLTKKKAIKSIESDYMNANYYAEYDMDIVNNESMHLIDDPSKYDLIIHDESHRFGSFPKPSGKAKLFVQMFYGKSVIMLSGTPHPESYSQLYHQFWITPFGPWNSYRNFYAWAKAGYVEVYQQRIGTHSINKYDRANEELIKRDVSKYMVTMTQAEAGFKSVVEESFMHVQMSDMTYSLCKRLLSDLVVEGKEEVILADTPAKLQQKLHQLYSGTIKFESGKARVLDYSKVDAIINRFESNKIAIFYKFIAEFNALKDRLGDKLTNSIEEFDSDQEKWIALQVVSGREGINLSRADYLIMYNIDFSATSYWQARDRMTVMSRERNEVIWVFSNGGIEDKVYKAVSKKKSYTSSVFKKDYGLTKQSK